MADITNDLQSYAGFDYSNAQTLLDFGRGLGAQFISQPYDVFRVTASSNGDVIQTANRVFQNFPVVRKKPQKMLLETGKGSTYFYDLEGDMSLIKVGDVFKLNDPAYGQGATSVDFATTEFVGFSLATHPVLEKNVGARLDRLVQVYRVSELADASGYLTQTFDGALPLKCVAGTWTLGTVGETAAKIPCGFAMDRKIRPPNIPGLPDQMPGSVWSIYVPSLKGFQFKETDWLVTEDGARYRVSNPFEQEAGATGSQLLCEREVSP